MGEVGFLRLVEVGEQPAHRLEGVGILSAGGGVLPGELAVHRLQSSFPLVALLPAVFTPALQTLLQEAQQSLIPIGPLG